MRDLLVYLFARALGRTGKAEQVGNDLAHTGYDPVLLAICVLALVAVGIGIYVYVSRRKGVPYISLWWTDLTVTGKFLTGVKAILVVAVLFLFVDITYGIGPISAIEDEFCCQRSHCNWLELLTFGAVIAVIVSWNVPHKKQCTTFGPAALSDLFSSGAMTRSALAIDLLSRHPEMADEFDLTSMTWIEWSVLLDRQPALADKCDLSRFTANALADLMVECEELLPRCPLDRFRAEQWELLLVHYPQLLPDFDKYALSADFDDSELNWLFNWIEGDYNPDACGKMVELLSSGGKLGLRGVEKVWVAYQKFKQTGVGPRRSFSSQLEYLNSLQHDCDDLMAVIGDGDARFGGSSMEVEEVLRLFAVLKEVLEQRKAQLGRLAAGGEKVVYQGGGRYA